MFVYPSVISHIVSGALLLMALVTAVFSFSKVKSLDAYRMIVLLLVGSIALGVHGLSHRYVLHQ